MTRPHNILFKCEKFITPSFVSSITDTDLKAVTRIWWTSTVITAFITLFYAFIYGYFQYYIYSVFLLIHTFWWGLNLLVFLKLRKMIEWFGFISQLFLIISAFIITILLGGLLQSGGLIMIGLIGPSYALAWPNKKRAIFLFVLYLILVFAAAVLQKYIDPIEQFTLTARLVIFLQVFTISSMFLFLALFSFVNQMILAKKLLKDEKLKLDKELAEAADYVRTMLPSPIHNGVINIDYKYTPSAGLGGDAFGYHWVDSDNFVVYLLDVSGHGVGAALLSTSVLNFIRSKALSHTNFLNPSQVFDKLNSAFQADKNNDMFFTMWYGIYNKESKIMTYSSAGHPPALMLTHKNVTEQSIVKLMSRNYIIGGISDTNYKQNSQLVSAGASIYIFSDGVYEIKKPDGSMLKFKEFEDLLINQIEKLGKTLDNFYDYCLKFSDNNRYDDDYTMIKISFV